MTIVFLLLVLSDADADWAAYLDRVNAGIVVKVERDIGDLKQKQALATRGKINPRLRTDVVWGNDRSPTWFKSGKAKSAVIADLKRDLEAAESRLEEIKAGKNKNVPWLRMRLTNLSAGEIGTIGSGQVLQVVDEKNCLFEIWDDSPVAGPVRAVRAGTIPRPVVGGSVPKTLIWLEVPTKDLTDDSKFSPSGLFRVVGKKSYDNANGATSTVWHLQPFTPPKD